jgi:formate dehydrogenase iron-sulfur subunit
MGANVTNAVLERVEMLESAEPTLRASKSRHATPAALPALPGTTLIEQLLRQQQDLTAVERFSQAHEHADVPAQARYYRDLIPLTAPGPSEQYAFEVDLDACTGCKGCVTACHNLNGLDDGETWRAVGQIISPEPQLPLFKMVTAACHHCAHPACMDGCPVKAYDKSPLTGIVKHLDDQCIGCQYCILKCPYDVPKYSKSRGIVRKCDMCSSRLEQQEAPACVQACPNTAIRITTVSREQIAARANTTLLPSAPESDYTQPSTVYRSRQPLPQNLRAADDAQFAPAHAHAPLISTLTLTQCGAGAMLAAAALFMKSEQTPERAVFSRALTILAFSLHFMGMKSALFHLGRPHLAFRAVLGLRTSWLSREVTAFGAVAGLDVLAILLPSARPAAAALSLAAVYCSMMIYVDTRRPFWALRFSAPRFFLSALSAGALAVSAVTIAPLALTALIALSALKIALEYQQLRARKDTTLTYAKKSAVLMTRELVRITALRFAAGMLGGMAIPLAVAATSTHSAAPLCAMAALWLLGEVCERYLFFTAVVPLKMPGGPAA